ncbi:Putative universal stress protein [Burkholderiaceae bacterium]|nr:Putative universal stress protein [Burkholderiaceae bacterium]
MFKKILVPTDGSELSTDAALRAVPLAKMASAKLTVLFVQDTYPYTGIGEANSAGLQAYMAAARAQGLSSVERIAEAARAEGVDIETVVVEDHQTAKGIVDAAQASGADLIMMGSHGRSGIAKLVLGSVAAKVLAISPIPVLVVK